MTPTPFLLICKSRGGVSSVHTNKIYITFKYKLLGCYNCRSLLPQI